jgi:hypothetical protein
MGEMSPKLVGTSFDLFIEAFGRIPVSMCFMLKSEAVATKGHLESGCASDEKRGVRDVVFLLQFTKKNLCQTNILGGPKLHMEKLVRVRIDGRVQPVALIIDSDHCLVECNVIRATALIERD